MVLWRTSIFWPQNFHSELKILGGLFRAPLQFLSTNMAFSECRISILKRKILIFSAEFAYSECGVCLFWAQNLHFLSMEFWDLLKVPQCCQWRVTYPRQWVSTCRAPPPPKTPADPGNPPPLSTSGSPPWFSCVPEGYPDPLPAAPTTYIQIQRL